MTDGKEIRAGCNENLGTDGLGFTSIQATAYAACANKKQKPYVTVYSKDGCIGDSEQIEALVNDRSPCKEIVFTGSGVGGVGATVGGKSASFECKEPK